MEQSECPYCDQVLSAQGYFCPNCLQQVRCKQCLEGLIPKAKGCVFCGETLSSDRSISRIATPASPSSLLVMNRISIKETREERSVDAQFTDNVAGKVTDLWSGRNFPGHNNFSNEISVHDDVEDESIVVGSRVVQGIDGEALSAKGQAIDERIPSSVKAIFELKDGKPVLRDVNLKGETKRDFRKRATVLAIRFIDETTSQLSVPREDLVEMLKAVKWFDSNYYKAEELGDRSVFSIDDKHNVRLMVAGEKLAQQYLSEIGDDAVPSTPSPRVAQKRGNTSKTVGEQSSGKGNGAESGSAKPKSTKGSAVNVKDKVESWDALIGNKDVKLSAHGKLEQAITGLYAFQQVLAEKRPIGREELEAFLREAFGVTYSARQIGDRFSREDGKKLVTYDRGKGYRLRSAGESVARKILEI